jgi:hypothetical protein
VDGRVSIFFLRIEEKKNALRLTFSFFSSVIDNQGG